MTQQGYPWFPTSNTGLSLSVPIFASGGKRSRVNQAKLDLIKIANTKTQVEQGLQLEVTQARAEFLTALQNYYSEKQNVELSIKIYRKALVKYSEGLESSIELTQQHNQYLRAEQTYFQTVLSLLNAKNRLDKTLGNY